MSWLLGNNSGGIKVDDDSGARIDALEAKVAALQEALDRTAAAPAARVAASDEAERHGFSRRRLLGAGTAVAAGAAGVVLGTPSPALALTPATDVTVTPGGGISSTNAQSALLELDGEKAPLANPIFTGVAKFPQARFQIHPFVDVRWHGAVGNGSTDDTAAIQAAINAAAFIQGATVFFPPGFYRFNDEIVVPDNVDLWGCGGHGQSSTRKGTVLQAGHADARLVFHGTGGQSGNLIVHGLHTDPGPTNGMVYIDGVERCFTALRVVGSKTDGLVLEKAQNCTFTQLLVSDCEGDGLILDFGAGGNAFLRCEFSGCAGDNVRIREQYGTFEYPEPRHNLFLHCILERGLWQNNGWNGPNNALLEVTAGYLNKFSHCVFSLRDPHTSGTGYLAVVGPIADEGTTGTAVTFDDCSFGADSVDGIHNTGAGVHFTGINRFQGTDVAITWDNHASGNAWGDVFGTFRYSGVTTRWTTATGANWGNKSVDIKFPLLTITETASAWALRTTVAGETGYRFQVTKNGELQAANGSDFVPRATWKLQGDGSGWESPEDVQLDTTLTIKESGTPASPTAGDKAVIYVRQDPGGADKLVVAYNDGGTMRYRWLPLSGTGATWTHQTTAP